MDGLLTTPLRRIPTPGGHVFHGMKATDPGFAGFGEAYFSFVQCGFVKGWKRHERMTLNFVVPEGEIQVVAHDVDTGEQATFVLGPRDDSTYMRLTIRPGLWVGFGGLGKGVNLLLNVASIPHDPTESSTRPLDAFPWQWVGGQP